MLSNWQIQLNNSNLNYLSNICYFSQWLWLLNNGRISYYHPWIAAHFGRCLFEKGHVLVSLTLLYFIGQLSLSIILKRSLDFLLCTQEGKRTVYLISMRKYMAVTTDLNPCSRSGLITFTVRITKRHPVNISFLKKLVQCSIESQSVLPS